MRLDEMEIMKKRTSRQRWTEPTLGGQAGEVRNEHGKEKPLKEYEKDRRKTRGCFIAIALSATQAHLLFLLLFPFKIVYPLLSKEERSQLTASEHRK